MTLLLCGGAAAQSNVTLYGIVDVGVQWNKQYSTASGQQEGVWSVDSGYQSGSRLGVRGAEALGSGLNAIFTLESGFDASTGQLTQGGLMFGRQAWVGMQGGWGTLVGGRIPTPSSGTGAYDMWSIVDPFGAGFGVNQTGTTFIAANALRQDNAALYVSPVMAGFKGAAGYSFNRSGSETSPQGSNSTAVNLAASFSTGAFYAVVTYDVLSYPDGGSATSNAGNPDQKLLQIGGTFDFKVAKLHAAWASQSDISAVRAGVSIAPPSGVTAYDNQAWMMGVSVPFGRSSLLASYQVANAGSVSYATATGIAYFEPDYDVWGLGYTYKFSDRTNLHAGYGRVSAKGTLDSTRVDRQQAAMGLRHRF
ncbi:MAG: porin [Burkholderiaceae bacterium]|nr:porin [Burkholderiaceae bacterium]MDH5208755.1 porin [Burkholderiaceae bacterium]